MEAIYSRKGERVVSMDLSCGTSAGCAAGNEREQRC